MNEENKKEKISDPVSQPKKEEVDLSKQIEYLKESLNENISETIKNNIYSIIKEKRNSIIEKILNFGIWGAGLIFLVFIIFSCFYHKYNDLGNILWLFPIFFLILLLCVFGAVYFSSKPED